MALACARRPWLTVGAWVFAIIVALALTSTLLGGNLTSDGKVTNNPESLRGYALQAERFPQQQTFDELVVLGSHSLSVDDAVFRSRVAELAAALEKTGDVDSTVTYATGPKELISSDRHSTLIALTIVEPGEDHIEGVIATVKRFDAKDGFTAAITGNFTFDHDFGEVSERDLQNGELSLGLPAALIVLIIVFGALVAASVPLLLAIISILVALGLTSVIAVQWELSLFVTNMLTAMGLALGIDYALFIVSRFREERARGLEKTAAIGASGATANRAVLFSGSSFVLAMTGLLLVQSTVMRSLALGAILVGIVSVVAALTLLPAVLQLLGDRINAVRVPFLGRNIEKPTGGSRFWGWIVNRVVRRPALSLTLGVAILVAAAVPAFGMNIGAAGVSTLPNDLTSKRGFLALQQSFPQVSAEPAEVVIDGDLSSAGVTTAIQKLQRELARDSRFGPPSLQVSPSHDLGVLRVPLVGDTLGDDAVAAVRELRADLVPAAFAEVADTEVLVTGTTAENVDYFDVMSHWLPLVLIFVFGVTFILLTVAFRSIVVPATAILLNLLSVGAAYGLLVLVFQHGVASGLLGFQQVDVVEAWVPLFLFAVLFGLSMDYQVFLLSRIRERFSETRDNSDAITFGITSTARIITGAALIIVAVFAGFAAGDLVMFQQMGFGIAIALLVDATLIRSVLVPASMTLLSDRNWYLPGWLQWLPHLDVEGHADPKADPPPVAAPTA